MWRRVETGIKLDSPSSHNRAVLRKARRGTEFRLINVPLIPSHLHRRASAGVASALREVIPHIVCKFPLKLRVRLLPYTLGRALCRDATQSSGSEPSLQRHGKGFYFSTSVGSREATVTLFPIKSSAAGPRQLWVIRSCRRKRLHRLGMPPTSTRDAR